MPKPRSTPQRADVRPELTVSMPAHNSRHHIEAGIRSVLSQTAVDLELIVVDDGSTDGTADVVRAVQDPRVRLISNGRRRGEAHCHNLVSARSRAPFVAHVRARDLVLAGGFEKLLEAARRSPGTGFVEGYAFETDANGRITREAFRARRRRLLRTWPPDADYRGILLRSAPGGYGLRVYRREALQAVGGLDEGRGDDAAFDVALRIADRFSIAPVPAFVYARRRSVTVGRARAAGQAVARWWRRLVHCRRLRASGRVRFLGDPRYNPIRLLTAGLWEQLGVAGVVHAARGRLERSRTRALRRLVDRLYYGSVAHLGRWPLVPLRSPRVRSARRIAYYTWHFPVLSQTFVHREVAALKRSGLSIAIVADAPEPPELADADAISLLGDTEYLGTPEPAYVRHWHWKLFRRHPLRYLALFVYVLSRQYGPFKSLGEDLTLFSRCVLLAGVLGEGRVDHIHSPWADRSAFIALVASRLLGVSHSVHARASDIHRKSSRVGLEERIAHAEFVVTNSRFNVGHLRSLAGTLHQPPPYLIYNGVDLTRFSSGRARRRQPGTIRLLCVARLIEPKGLVYLLKACRMLERQGEDFVCDVVGGPEEPLFANYFVRLMQVHRELDLADRVIFHGAKPFAEVLEHYRRADIFTLPCVVGADGTHDITPNALIEAMAMRLPVVSTTITALPEIVEDGVSGLLVPPADAVALARALSRLIHDPDLRRRLGDNARARIEQRFDINANIVEYAKLFRGGAPDV